MKWGGLCKTCHSGKCVDEPTAMCPVTLECTSCDGKGCNVCGNEGRFNIDRCPRKLIPGSVWTLMQAAKFADKGTWPLRAGLLGQAADFVRVCNIVWTDDRTWKAKLKIWE